MKKMTKISLDLHINNRKFFFSLYTTLWQFQNYDKIIIDNIKTALTTMLLNVVLH